jgi:hypothetical protein
MSGFDEKPVTQLKEITGPSGIKGAYKQDNMYFIPAGTKLYRGDSKFTDIDNTDLLKGNYKFFTPDENYAQKYGNVFEFETTTDLNLVAMDDISEQFYNKALKSHVGIAKIMRDNYGYGTKPQERDSDQKKDNAMSEYICKQGYQGYAANTMKSKEFADDLNAEVIICNPKNHLTPISLVTKIEREAPKLKRGNSKRDRVGPINMGALNFGDDDDEVKPPNMGALDFGDDDDEYAGGKTKKSKKSNKKPSKKKKTKTQKKRKSRKSKTNKK